MYDVPEPGLIQRNPSGSPSSSWHVIVSRGSSGRVCRSCAYATPHHPERAVQSHARSERPSSEIAVRLVPATAVRSMAPERSAQGVEAGPRGVRSSVATTGTSTPSKETFDRTAGLPSASRSGAESSPSHALHTVAHTSTTVTASRRNKSRRRSALTSSSPPGVRLRSSSFRGTFASRCPCRRPRL